VINVEWFEAGIVFQERVCNFAFDMEWRAGVPLKRVSILLGHTSVRITEKHYAPWVREQQEQAEADVKRTWAHDPIALLETKGTPEVHEKRSGAN